MTRGGAVLTGLAVALATGLASSCASPTDSAGHDGASLVGRWSFTAAQTTPESAELVGTLEITSSRGAGFDGRLDAVLVDGAGTARRVGGVVTGRRLDGVTVDFDAFLSGGARRHLGTLAGDSLRGQWVEPSESGIASGSFVARRS